MKGKSKEVKSKRVREVVKITFSELSQSLACIAAVSKTRACDCRPVTFPRESHLEEAFAGAKLLKYPPRVAFLGRAQGQNDKISATGCLFGTSAGVQETASAVIMHLQGAPELVGRKEEGARNQEPGTAREVPPMSPISLRCHGCSAECIKLPVTTVFVVSTSSSTKYRGSILRVVCVEAPLAGGQPKFSTSLEIGTVLYVLYYPPRARILLRHGPMQYLISPKHAPLPVRAN